MIANKACTAIIIIATILIGCGRNKTQDFSEIEKECVDLALNAIEKNDYSYSQFEDARIDPGEPVWLGGEGFIFRENEDQDGYLNFINYSAARDGSSRLVPGISLLLRTSWTQLYGKNKTTENFDPSAIDPRINVKLKCNPDLKLGDHLRPYLENWGIDQDGRISSSSQRNIVNKFGCSFLEHESKTQRLYMNTSDDRMSFIPPPITCKNISTTGLCTARRILANGIQISYYFDELLIGDFKSIDNFITSEIERARIISGEQQ
ncbi:MAG: hypothetical protein VW877_04845 [Pseudomonadaceae bacterium]